MGVPTLIGMSANVVIATGGVLCLFITATLNSGFICAQVVDEVSGAVFDQEDTDDLLANTQ